MPRQVQTAVENNFTRGLITENTALQFPANACTETFDCIFDQSGRVTRRYGFEYEADALQPVAGFVDADEAFVEFTWTNVGGQAQSHFFVQQQGNTLHFYDLSSDTTLSLNKKDFTVDLTDHLPDISEEVPGLFPCQFAVSDGDLIVVNKVCDPFSLAYSAESDDVTAVTIDLKIRDFAGVDDGLAINTRPTASTAGLIATNPQHYYNLLNQGWHISDALAQWDAARSDMPSNADIVSLYRASTTDAFDNARVTANSPGNTPAPKGHFILSVTDVDRPTAITDDGLTGVGSITSQVEISRTLGTTFGTMTGGGGSSAAFDGTTNQGGLVSAVGGNGGYIGKDFSGGTPFRITQCLVYGPNDGGYVNGINPTVDIIMYASNTAPTSSIDGTTLGSISFTDSTNESSNRTITSSNPLTFYKYVWLRITHNGAASNVAISEIRFFTVGSMSNPGGLEPFSTIERPSTVTHFNSRIFYSGIDNALIGNNIYFTPIIEFDEQREKCYQQNDPTSEDVSDLLPSDGGVIRIQDMGSVKKLFSMRSAVLAFANNGTWLISGSQGAGFRADDYVISRLSNTGTQSPLSFVDYKGTPIWWADDGIYTVKFNPDYNSFEAVSLTDDTIKSFLSEIPVANRPYVKGVYSIAEDLIYWLYHSSEDPSRAYAYNRVLVFNPNSKAFYPWTISQVDLSGPPTGPRIRGIARIQDAETNEPEVIKYTTTRELTADTEELSFAETRATNYIDWFDYDSVGSDYSSYFITGYSLSQNTVPYMQSNYVTVYLETEEDSSCYMQGVFDFTTSGASGKWSSLQQIYNPDLTDRSLNYKRLKVRGKGKSLQLRFESETECPFNIIGWSVWSTQNAGP